MVWYFKLRGWKTGANVPPELKKCVMIVAPHTSGWDFIYGAAAKSLLGFDAKYLAKKELFRFRIIRSPSLITRAGLLRRHWPDQTVNSLSESRTTS